MSEKNLRHQDDEAEFRAHNAVIENILSRLAALERAGVEPRTEWKDTPPELVCPECRCNIKAIGHTIPCSWPNPPAPVVEKPQMTNDKAATDQEVAECKVECENILKGLPQGFLGVARSRATKELKLIARIEALQSEITGLRSTVTAPELVEAVKAMILLVEDYEAKTCKVIRAAITIGKSDWKAEAKERELAMHRMFEFLDVLRTALSAQEPKVCRCGDSCEVAVIETEICTNCGSPIKVKE